MTYTCPICGYDGLKEPFPAQDELSTWAICPCCGNESGYDDATSTHAELREEWIAGGCRWWSDSRECPAGWSAREQL